MPLRRDCDECIRHPVIPFDDTVSAFVGEPRVLVAGADRGPLGGAKVAVKDLFDIAGNVTGGGNPAFVRDRPAATTTAPAVARLVNAGAAVVGKTITDELAFSLSGPNVHFGTPRNTGAPDRGPGGSSAGSAAAVAAGLVDLAVGTDTAGSVRVPASYCGIVGWRSSHGAIPIDGVVPLAPSFETVGLFARDLRLLRRGAQALLPGGARASSPSRFGSWNHCRLTGVVSIGRARGPCGRGVLRYFVR